MARTRQPGDRGAQPRGGRGNATGRGARGHAGRPQGGGIAYRPRRASRRVPGRRCTASPGGAADHAFLAEALAALDRALIEASEAEDRIARAAEAMAFDPARLEQAEARLFDIRRLARKHRVEPDQLAALGAQMREQLAAIEAGGKRIAELDRQLEQARKSYFEAAT